MIFAQTYQFSESTWELPLSFISWTGVLYVIMSLLSTMPSPIIILGQTTCMKYAFSFDTPVSPMEKMRNSHASIITQCCWCSKEIYGLFTTVLNVCCSCCHYYDDGKIRQKHSLGLSVSHNAGMCLERGGSHSMGHGSILSGYWSYIWRQNKVAEPTSQRKWSIHILFWTFNVTHIKKNPQYKICANMQVLVIACVAYVQLIFPTFTSKQG